VVRAGVVLAVVAAAAIARPSQLRTTLTSPAALVRIGALVLAVAGWSLLVRRLVRPRLPRTLLLVLPAAAIVALVLVPSFRTTRIDEALPTTAADLLDAPAAPAATASTAAPAPAAAATTQATAAKQPAPAAPASTAAPAATTAPATTAATTAAPGAAAVPVTLSSGTLRGIGHRASGGARILRLADGTAFVRFDDISIESGPDYVVHLVPGADRHRPAGGVELGRLRAVRGSHSYAIPAGTDLSGPWTVLVWCRAFAVPVAAATQQPA
jgi:hypothetical protein